MNVKEEKALYDLSTIDTKRQGRGGYVLLCQECGKWAKHLETKDGQVWTCHKCAGSIKTTR